MTAHTATFSDIKKIGIKCGLHNLESSVPRNQFSPGGLVKDGLVCASPVAGFYTGLILKLVSMEDNAS